MKNTFFSKKAKFTMDVLMGVGFIAVAIFSKKQQSMDYDHIWGSLHAITSLLWCFLISIHIVQHWKFIKAFTRKKMILKNRITALTLLFTLLMAVSILIFIMKTDFFSLHFHGIIGRLFILTIIAHVIHQLGFKNRRKKKIK